VITKANIYIWNCFYHQLKTRTSISIQHWMTQKSYPRWIFALNEKRFSIWILYNKVQQLYYDYSLVVNKQNDMIWKYNFNKYYCNIDKMNKSTTFRLKLKWFVAQFSPELFPLCLTGDQICVLLFLWLWPIVYEYLFAYPLEKGNKVESAKYTHHVFVLFLVFISKEYICTGKLKVYEVLFKI